MRFTSFTGPKNPTKHGKNAKVAKSTRVCPPTGESSIFRGMGRQGQGSLGILRVLEILDNSTILCKIITRMKLLFSNYLGGYSYSFQGSSELISITVTVSLFF